MILSSEERETISRELWVGRSFRFIGRVLGRHHSVVAREVARNGGRLAYRALRSGKRAAAMRKRPKPRKLEQFGRLLGCVMADLDRRWSPRQIATRIRMESPTEPEMRVSHETVCQTLFVQGKASCGP
ncbi:helix-turn-helix domain-containing protein [Actinokineospora auranticolor]|uniref:helix-turn-helix domain-containing protein n=1 Tax=Actinokineospora auranticolor TaxID=155976 RepID=UPI0015E2C0AE